jgi:hypothetical protein
MASAARTAPKSRPAAFGGLNHRAVGIANRSGRDCSAGDGRKTESQRDAQKHRSHHFRIPPCLYESAPSIELIHGTLGNKFLDQGRKASIPQWREAVSHEIFG